MAILNFVMKMGCDAALQRRFNRDPDAALAQSGLSSEEKAALKSGDPIRINQAIVAGAQASGIQSGQLGTAVAAPGVFAPASGVRAPGVAPVRATGVNVVRAPGVTPVRASGADVRAPGLTGLKAPGVFAPTATAN